MLEARARFLVKKLEVNYLGVQGFRVRLQNFCDRPQTRIAGLGTAVVQVTKKYSRGTASGPCPAGSRCLAASLH